VETSYDANARPVKQALTSGGTIYSLIQLSYDAMGRTDCVAQRMNPAIFATIATPACSLGIQGSGANDFGPDRIVRSEYDEVGRVKKTTSAYGTAVPSEDMRVTFTGNGQVFELFDAENNKTTFEYDGFDRLSKTRYPSPTKGSGTSSTTDFEQVLAYDNNHNPTLVRNRAGEQTSLAFDNLGRLTTKTLPNAEPAVTYAYDLLGRMTGASSSAGALTFTYDPLGRLVDQVQPLGTVHSDYDLAGRRTGISYPGGFSLAQDFYTTGEIWHVMENGSPSVTLGTYEYDNLGRRSKLADGNGVLTTYGYDPVSRLQSLTHDLIGTDYDVTLGFSYNPAGQIVQNTRSNDRYATASASPSLGTPANGLNQVSGLTYDARGNLTYDGTMTYNYTSENMMTSAGGVTMDHDPLMRLSKVVNGGTTNRYLYDGTRVVATYDAAGMTLINRYAFGPGADEPLITHVTNQSSITRYWFQADERGSTLTSSTSAGIPANPTAGYARYEEYGRQQTAGAGLYQYTSQKTVFGTALVDFKSRVYNPTIGRFMQADSIGYAAGANLYSFVHGDPVNFKDPLGKEEICTVATGSHIHHCVNVDGDGDGNPFEHDMNRSQVASFQDSYGGFIGTYGHGQDLSGYGKPVSGSATADEKVMTRVASQFVGYIGENFSSGRFKDTWDRIDEIVAERNFDADAGAYFTSIVLNVNPHTGDVTYRNTINIMGGMGNGDTTSVYNSPSDLARTMFHEPLHFFWNEQRNPSALDYQGVHNLIDYWARWVTVRFGLGRCRSAGGFPEC
jgi:RHS repeat-associated protein